MGSSSNKEDPLHRLDYWSYITREQKQTINKQEGQEEQEEQEEAKI